MRTLTLLCAAAAAAADLRMASHPRNAYSLLNGNGAIPFVRTNLVRRYMIPSTFAYRGLSYPGGQKYNDYDQFLRSNIDNEQDNRDFVTNRGMDHLPFRTKNTEVDTSFRTNRFDGAVVGPIDLRATVGPGESRLIPLRWNNPHSSELEANIWIFVEGLQPIVVPIRRPTCSGEGYQDNIFKFTVPADFAELGAKIPGFAGCSALSQPMCVVQVYGHSVESRTYALAFPIIVPGHDAALTTSSTAMIQPAAEDPWLDLGGLRDLCLANTDPSADISRAVPRWARLVSDVYNHAYQNSDFSPYSGQQHEGISKNLQASCVIKQVTGNRGELGRAILPPGARTLQAWLHHKQDQLYKAYEALANQIINTLGHEMEATGSISADGTSQQLAECFRCDQVGSTNTRRLETNTYIPSFQLPARLVARARALVPQQYASLITPSGQVQIYVATLDDLRPLFHDAAPYGLIYQPAMLKTTLTAMPDATEFRKRDADGNPDDGRHAATQAKLQLAESMGCPAACLTCTAGNAPLIRGNAATCVTGSCSGCRQLFANDPVRPAETAMSSLLRTGSALPGHGARISDYPDADGSPRVGRPSAPGEPNTPAPVATSVPDLGGTTPTTTAPTTTAPTTTAPTTTATTTTAPTTTATTTTAPTTTAPTTTATTATATTTTAPTTTATTTTAPTTTTTAPTTTAPTTTAPTTTAPTTTAPTTTAPTTTAPTTTAPTTTAPTTTAPTTTAPTTTAPTTTAPTTTAPTTTAPTTTAPTTTAPTTTTTAPTTTAPTTTAPTTTAPTTLAPTTTADILATTTSATSGMSTLATTTVTGTTAAASAQQVEGTLLLNVSDAAVFAGGASAEIRAALAAAVAEIAGVDAGAVAVELLTPRRLQPGAAEFSTVVVAYTIQVPADQAPAAVVERIMATDLNAATAAVARHLGDVGFDGAVEAFGLSAVIADEDAGADGMARIYLALIVGAAIGVAGGLFMISCCCCGYRCCCQARPQKGASAAALPDLVRLEEARHIKRADA